MRLLLFWLALPAASSPAESTGSPSRLSSIGAVLSAQPFPDQQTVTVRGTVTHTGAGLFLQDQTGAMHVQPRASALAVVGDEVEATGKPVVQGNEPSLADATLKDLWHSTPPPPLALQPDEAATGEHNTALVQVEGELLHVSELKGLTMLQMEGGHQFFTAELGEGGQISATEREHLLSLPVHSTVRLTGVLSLQPEQYSTTHGSFSLLLREPADVEVLKGPPWQTTPHILELVAALIGLGAALQFAHLRSVRRQFRAILAERARIARDVHDTLAQGFAGIALQLEVVRSDLARDPVVAETQLRTAAGMVRHCRAEAHRSISSLRAFSQPMPLDAMLRDLVGSLTGGVRGVVQLHLETPVPPPSQVVAEQLYRICQEAVSNASQHAAAQSIVVSLRVLHQALELSVWDNGVGFDVNRVNRGEHFGILGMRERAAQLGARWSLTSQPGSTQVCVTVPNRPSPSRTVQRLLAERWKAGRMQEQGLGG